MSNAPDWPQTYTVTSYKPRKRQHRVMITTRVPHCKHVITRSANHADINRAKGLAMNDLRDAVLGHTNHPAKS